MSPPKQLGALSNNITLGVYILILVLQFFCATVNGLIILFFARSRSLRRNKHMRLVIFLSIGDFFLAVGELPYIIYMTINWDAKQMDYDPLYIMITAEPLPIQLKISATITVGIAFGRNITLHKVLLSTECDEASGEPLIVTDDGTDRVALVYKEF
uniref:N-acetyltransferase domain-containing protein n=1 Tax=Caenorhabditis japonica TaxID=281687 RepID=A0A8R1DKE3_CAEJA